MTDKPYNEQDFRHFTKYLGSNEHSNLFFGFNHHEISAILQERPFSTKKGQHITDLKALYEHLGYTGYHRLLPPFHPRVNFEGKPNMTIQIESLAVDYYDTATNKMKLTIVLIASWEAALSETREDMGDGVTLPVYSELPPNEIGLQIHVSAQNGLTPGLSLKSTTGFCDTPAHHLGVAHFVVEPVDAPSDGRLAKFRSRAEHTYDVVTKGGYKDFPFDTKTVAFHFTSDVINSQVKFERPRYPNDNGDISQSLKCSQLNEWTASERDIHIKLLHRDLRYKDWPQDLLGTKRSKIVLMVRFKRSWPYWFMKMVLPMDIITFIGISVLLLVPAIGDVGPSAPERFAMVGLTVSVLLAQAAFTIAVQPMLPGVAYVTIIDIHNNFCFLITAAESIIFATVPARSWATFRKSSTIYPIWGAALFILFVEQVMILLWHNVQVGPLEGPLGNFDTKLQGVTLGSCTRT